MAITTRQDRTSLIRFGHLGGILPNPDTSGVSASERPIWAGLYNREITQFSIDNDRASWIGLGLESIHLFPHPDGDIDGLDRAQFLNLSRLVAGELSAGTVTGTSNVSGVAQSFHDSSSTISGLSTVSGAGNALYSATGTISGTSDVSGVGQKAVNLWFNEHWFNASWFNQFWFNVAVGPISFGLAEGTSTVTAFGQSTADSAGTITGTSTVSGVGSFVQPGQGSGLIQGTSVVTGATQSTADSAGTANGVATVAGVSGYKQDAVGTIAGTSTVSGVTSIIASISATGSIFGTSTVTGYSPTTVTGGASPRRRHRQFANVDGNLIEVGSYKEAVALINNLNKKSKKKVKKRRITFSNGPYASVYDADALPLKDIKENLNIFHDDEDMLLLLMMVA